MTTPDDLRIDMEPGDDVSKTVLDKLGVKSQDELAEIVEKHKRRDFYDKRHEDKANQLQVRVDELTEQLRQREEKEDFSDIADPTVKSLKREIKELRDSYTDLVMRSVVTDEDRELEPFIAEAKKSYPEIATSIKSPLRRLDAYREIARSLRSATETSANAGAKEHRRDSATRVGLTTGSAPVSARASTSDADILKKFRDDLAAAKHATEKEAVKRKYESKYPHLFS
jgi:hypothetical protein